MIVPPARIGKFAGGGAAKPAGKARKPSKRKLGPQVTSVLQPMPMARGLINR